MEDPFPLEKTWSDRGSVCVLCLMRVARQEGLPSERDRS